MGLILTKNKGFTLIEILIALVVIGIVAALVTPMLLVYINRHNYRSAFRKEFSVLSGALNKITSENGGSIKDLCNDSSEFRDLFSKRLNTMKVCNQGYSEGCRYSGATGQNGQDDGGFSWMQDVPAIVLADGAILQFYLSAKDCSDATHGCGMITIDVNGVKRPNREGEDVYMLHIFDNVVKPFGYDGDGYSPDCDTSTSMGWTCAFDRLKD